MTLGHAREIGLLPLCGTGTVDFLAGVLLHALARAVCGLGKDAAVRFLDVNGHASPENILAARKWCVP